MAGVWLITRARGATQTIVRRPQCRSPHFAKKRPRAHGGDGRREDGGGEGMRSREGSGGGWSGMHSS